EPNSSNKEYNLWRATKYLKRPAKRNLIIRKNNGNWCRSDEEHAEAFAQHLHSVFQPNDIDNPMTEAEIENFLGSPCQMSLPIKRIHFDEVVSEIKCLNNKKSPGPDKIDDITLKTLPLKCIRFLTLVFNAILRLDHFLSQWKCAEIIMILKPNKPEAELSSYRVPQGSVLGPVLYTLYTADMPATNNCTIATYADDTAILATSSSRDEASQLLQSELSLIEAWFLRWKIKINSLKSVQITFA
ncbi:hypothetical protein KR215_002096, partial [Drosophila sulfurigaster]